MNDVVMAGIWKFQPGISRDQLVEFAKEWINRPQVLELHVRGCGEKTYGLGFQITLEDGNKKTYDRMFHEVKSILRGRFGPDSLRSWDIYSPTTVLKRVAL